MRPRFLVQSLIVLGLALPVFAQEGKKLDQDFSQGMGGFTVATTRTTPDVSDKVTHDGKKAVELLGNPSPDVITALTWKSPAVRLLKGQQYTISAFVKTENVGSVELKIDLPANAGAKGLSSEKLTGTNDWKQLKQTFTVSEDVQPGAISVQLVGGGKAYVSEFGFDGKVGAEWTRKVIVNHMDVKAGLQAEKLASSKPTNWFAGRWPYISFLGGMVMGCDSADWEFFYDKPFKYYTTSLDFIMEGQGKVFGIRFKVDRYKERMNGGKPAPMVSFLLDYRPYILGAEYYPSYIYVNGRKIWDRTKGDPMNSVGAIQVPFSVEEGVDPQIDLVVDKNATPDTKGLAFRMLYVNYIGEPSAPLCTPGLKVDTDDAEVKVTAGSPADKPEMKHFQFGLFPSGYDFWTEKGPTFAQIKKDWKPNFKPDYPTDTYYSSPFTEGGVAKGKYHEFMISYGGCNVAGAGATPDMFKANPYLLGAMADTQNAAGEAKKVLDIDPRLQAFWWRGESGAGPNDKSVIDAQKKATGAPDRVLNMCEPWPPSLAWHREYERGTDLLIFKNEEDPQWNIVTAMCRGAGRTFDKPFGFYWEQTHYPYPSLDEKLHACMMYYFSGGSWISAELDSAPAFEKDIVAEWVYPLVQASRFAMVHPARGTPIIPIGIPYQSNDSWTAPYNPFGHMDTFRRYVEFDSATNKLTCEPSFTKVFPWMRQPVTNGSLWQYNGHVGLYLDKVEELRGYDLLDVFFPQYGDAFTAHITRLLTGTPYGQVDFVPLDKTDANHLKTYGVLACLGKMMIRVDPRADTETSLTEAAKAGSQVIMGAQDFIGGSGISGKPFGLAFDKQTIKVEGDVTGMKEIFGDKTGKFSGEMFTVKGDGWETVASVNDPAAQGSAAASKPLVVRKKFDKGMVYIYLGKWVYQGGDAIRPVLAYCGEQAAPLKFAKVDDYMEYVAYKKGAGAWVALFNHGNIVVGCDRLDPSKWRVQPPEPLASKPRGVYSGTVEFRLDKLGLDPAAEYDVYEIGGIDGKAFEGVISGNKTFEVKRIDSQKKDGVISATVTVDKRAEYVVAPKGKGTEVFFGK